VTSNGRHDVGSVEFTDRDGAVIRRSGVPLPWRVTFRAPGEHHPLVLIAQRTRGAGKGHVTCTITVDGKVLSSATQNGRYAAPECSG
jgi:hypothetical protein